LFIVEVVYYKSIKREVKMKPIYEYRYDERLKTIAEESTRLAYTGLLGELKHLKIKTRLNRCVYLQQNGFGWVE
jgi:hypothetical protein